MRDFFKNKLVTIIVVIATVVLAGIAIFTAVRLYQLRQESISPARPESAPEAATSNYESCSAFTFKLSETPPPEITVCDAKEAYRDNTDNTPGNYSASFTEDQKIGTSDTVTLGEILVYRIVPSPLTSVTPFEISDTLSNKVTFLDSEDGCDYDDATRTITCGSARTYKAYRVTVNDDASGIIENSASINGALSPVSCQLGLTIEGSTPTPSPTGSPTATPTGTPTATPTQSPTPSGSSTPTASATSTASPTPTSTTVAQASPTAQPELPNAGVGTPTILGISAGVILLLISFAFAL